MSDETRGLIHDNASLYNCRFKLQVGLSIQARKRSANSRPNSKSRSFPFITYDSGTCH